MKKYIFATALTLSLGLTACKKSSTTEESNSNDNSEAVQQIGETMASIDESGGSTSTLGYLKTMERLAPQILIESESTELEAMAACGTAGFSSCTNNVISRDFGGCTVRAATVTGTIAFTWTDAAVDNTCLMGTTGHSIRRVPNFSMTGNRGLATLAVNATGTLGQNIQKTGGTTYTFSNQGIRRKFTLSGTTLFDFTTSTGSMGISGATRGSRMISGGSISVANNVSGRTCNYVPSNLTWTSTCNCATSGSWAGTCSDGTTSNLTITGCGTADYTLDGSSSSVTFDRCYSL